MKTVHNTSSKNSNRIRERVRLGMTLAGIVTAIIGSVALLYEIPFIQRKVSLPRFVETHSFIETPKMTVAEIPVEVVGNSVVAVLWPF